MSAPRNIAILGGGREGRAAEDWCRRKWPQARLRVYDDADSDRPLPRGKQWDGIDLAIASPGIAPHHPAIVDARRAEVRITTGTQLWFEQQPSGRTVVISGTKGKSTTAAALAHVLKGEIEDVVLAGNIGLPLLSLKPGSPETVYVIELSSYQLHELIFCCDVGVLLNLFPEHLDWHEGREAYYACKLRVLSAARRALADASNATLKKMAPSGVQWFNIDSGLHLVGQTLFEAETAVGALQTQLLGQHNQHNMVAVIAAAKELGIAPQQSMSRLPSFQSLPHRLHRLGVQHGLQWVDDSISTTPQSTLAAAASLADETLTLLVGGFDRGLDWSPFVEQMPGNVDLLIGIGAQGQRIIEQVSSSSSAPRTAAVDDLPAAVEASRTQSRQGATVVLSPGAPSYGEFTDFKQRGRRFAQLAGFDVAAQD